MNDDDIKCDDIEIAIIQGVLEAYTEHDCSKVFKLLGKQTLGVMVESLAVYVNSAKCEDFAFDVGEAVWAYRECQKERSN